MVHNHNNNDNNAATSNNNANDNSNHHDRWTVRQTNLGPFATPSPNDTTTSATTAPSQNEQTPTCTPTSDDTPPRRHNRKSHSARKKIAQTHTPDNCTDPNCYSCATENIINLSGIPLFRAQTMVLSKGLSFVPTAVNVEPKEIVRDFNIFTNKANRKLSQMVNPPRINKTSTTKEPVPPRRTNSHDNDRRTIVGPGATLEDAFKEARLEISEMHPNQTTKHNLTRAERLALRELTANRSLIVDKADKGSTIVVRHRDDYIRDGLEHLSDPNTYLELDKDYTGEMYTFVNKTLQDFKIRSLLSPGMADYCFPPKTPRTSQIYFLLKIHKNPMSVRPIVSTIDSPTANILAFLDHYLQPVMKQLPAYLKDTTQFLNELTNIRVRPDTWLVTVDVKSLYTNIPNDSGINACYEAWLQQEWTDPQHPPAEILRYLLQIVLKLNTFEFNQKHYLQKFGTAMGFKLAPAYTNTFMGKLEKSILNTSPLKQPQLVSWKL